MHDLEVDIFARPDMPEQLPDAPCRCLLHPLPFGTYLHLVPLLYCPITVPHAHAAVWCSNDRAGANSYMSGMHACMHA